MKKPLDPMLLGMIGFIAFPFIMLAVVMLISPFMNWLNGYGFTWIF
jgi:hypothetical protein